jgi:hypothetical protein
LPLADPLNRFKEPEKSAYGLDVDQNLGGRKSYDSASSIDLIYLNELQLELLVYFRPLIDA